MHKEQQYRIQKLIFDSNFRNLLYAQFATHTLVNLFKTNLSLTKKYTKNSHYDYLML